MPNSWPVSGHCSADPSRAEAPKSGSPNLRLDPITRKAWCKEKEIHLTSKEYALLEFFIRNPNQVLSRSAIVENVWPNMESVKFTNIVSVYASFLRKKIDKVTGRNLIHTVPGIGYILKET